MGALSPILRRSNENLLTFWCPGCKSAHTIQHGPGGWTWNGNVDKPTFSPSLLLRSGHLAPNFKPGDSCWCTYYAEHPDESESAATRFECGVCHTFVTDGRIQYLADCTHKLAGQTVDIPPFPGNYQIEA